MKATLQKNTPYSKLLITVGIVLLSAVFFTMISTGLAVAVYGVDMETIQSMMSDYSDPRTLPILKLVQTITSIGVFVIPPFFLAYLFSQQPGEYIGLTKGPGRGFALAIIAMLAAVPFINFLGELNSNMSLPGSLRFIETWMKETEAKAAEVTKLFLQMSTPADLMINLLMLAIIPAIGEELLFRGIVQNIFSEWWKNKHVAIWVTAILFSAFHMQFYGFVPRMLLGAMLGYFYFWSGSIWLSVIAHFTNNAGAVIFSYLFQHGYSNIDPDAIGTKSDMASVIISVLITTGIFWVIKKRSETVTTNLSQ